MRRATLVLALAALLAGPTALAFFSGGYFDVPRLWAALGMWLGVVAIAVLAPQRLPRSRPALRLAWPGRRAPALAPREEAVR